MATTRTRPANRDRTGLGERTWLVVIAETSRCAVLTASQAADIAIIARHDRTSESSSTELVFYQMDNGGHTWPGGKQYLPQAIIGGTSRALDASDGHCTVFWRPPATSPVQRWQDGHQYATRSPLSS
jgi:poly(3-hydroxybutyrate) depolymerase